MATYHPPVNQLLTLGDVRSTRNWPNYLALGLTAADVPALLEMATDEDLDWADSDSLEVWAPVHARRALAQLRAEASIRPLVALIGEREDDDWLQDEAEQILVAFGPRILPVLADFLATAPADAGSSAILNVVGAIGQIGKKFPEARQRVIDILLRRLRLAEQQDEGVLGFIVDALVDLKAKSALPAIAEVFVAETLDEMVINWQLVQKNFGLASTARPKDFLARDP